MINTLAHNEESEKMVDESDEVPEPIFSSEIILLVLENAWFNAQQNVEKFSNNLWFFDFLDHSLLVRRENNNVD